MIKISKCKRFLTLEGMNLTINITKILYFFKEEDSGITVVMSGIPEGRNNPIYVPENYAQEFDRIIQISVF